MRLLGAIEAVQHRRPMSGRARLAVVIGYVAATSGALAGAQLFTTRDGISLWFPAAGLTLGLFLLAGVRFAPLALVVRVVAGRLTFFHGSLTFTILGSLVDIAIYALGALVLERLLPVYRRPRHLQDVVVLLVASLATVGVASVATLTVGVALDSLAWSAFPAATWSFWVGDAIGVVSIVPLCLVASSWSTDRRPASPGSTRAAESTWARVETVLQAAALAGAALWAVDGSLHSAGHLYPAFIPLTWLALRRGYRASVLAVFVTTGLVTSASRLARLPVHDIQTLQLFMVAFSVAGLLMGARETERTTALRHLADSEQRLRGDVIERQTALEALRHSEERYRTIVQTAREGIWSLDVRRRTNFVNPRMAAMLGYTPEEMVGRPMDDFLDDEGRGIVDEFVTARRASQPEPVDFKLCHRDGSAVWVMVSVAPLRDAKGKREGTLSLATEVTQRRRQEQELADANQELREANALKDHFVAVTSHELRTPLTAILGFTRTTLDLWERLCDEEKLDFLGRIERQSRRLHQLVEDVLTLAALDSGGLRVVCEPVSLRPIIDDAIASVAPIGAVVVSCDPDIRVSADPSRLHQILVNYLVNAVAYGESPLSVEVTPARRTVEVRVRDNGDGVPVEFVPHLFERFTQASAARTRRARGSGLGLAIVAELTEAMGGGAWYEEPGGAGPCFAVSIPGVPADTARRRRSVDNDSEASRVVHT